MLMLSRIGSRFIGLLLGTKAGWLPRLRNYIVDNKPKMKFDKLLSLRQRLHLQRMYKKGIYQCDRLKDNDVIQKRRRLLLRLRTNRGFIVTNHESLSQAPINC